MHRESNLGARCFFMRLQYAFGGGGRRCLGRPVGLAKGATHLSRYSFCQCWLFGLGMDGTWRRCSSCSCSTAKGAIHLLRNSFASIGCSVEKWVVPIGVDGAVGLLALSRGSWEVDGKL